MIHGPIQREILFLSAHLETSRSCLDAGQQPTLSDRGRQWALDRLQILRAMERPASPPLAPFLKAKRV